MLANLVETIDKRVEAQVEALQVRMEELNERLKLVEALEEQLTSAITLLDTTLNAQRPGTTATLDLDSEEFRDAVREIANAAVETHCEEYDHDLIHEEGDTEDAIDTAVRQALRGARIELR
jgi:hypothetical protein